MEKTTTSTTTTSSASTTNSEESKDEVDFVVVSNNNNNNINFDLKQKNTNKSISSNNNIHCNSNDNKTNGTNTKRNSNTSGNVPNSSVNKQKQTQVPNKEAVSINNNNNNNNNNTTVAKSKKLNNAETQQAKKSVTTKERLSLFSFSKKNSQKTATTPTTPTTPPTRLIYNTTSTTTKTPALAANDLINQSSNEEQEKSTTFIPPCQPPFVPIGTPPRQHKFVKSSSIARLFGNTYNAKKFEKDEQKRLASSINTNGGKFNTYGGRRRATGPYLERFKRYSKEDGDIASDTLEASAVTVGGVTLTTDSRDFFGGSRNELVGLEHHYHESERQHDLSSKALRTISRGLGKLWFKRTHSVEISAPDPEFKVSYLGNVLTGWAKGEGCVEKQLNTLWRNYTQNNKPDVIMRIKVCASGLKATTRQHGLTEYWANRITHCCAPKNYPRVFCWIYRHEGRKLKHELRCHAVLCSKEKIVHDICNTLKENLERALRDFKREKILKQNARLSLANAAYDNPSLPRRKILLSVGGNNYRPPLERSKSAPKLMAIEEAIGEEDGEEAEDTNEPEMKACCQKDSLYPAMTLGRRRCRRGHSIRRTGKTRSNFGECMQMEVSCCGDSKCKETKDNKVATTAADNIAAAADNIATGIEPETELRNSYGSDDSDDFEKLLKYNNYDANASLSNELLPYFDMQLHKNTSSSLGSLTELKDYEEPLSLLPTINSDPSADPEADYSPHMETNEVDETVMMVGLRRNGVCSDGEEDYLDADDMYFRQASILNMLHRNSMRKMANLCLSSDENSSIETNASTSINYRHQVQSSISSNASSTATSVSATLETANAAGLTAANEANGMQRKQQLNTADSDEGSISSGCETASTVTANQDDLSLKYRQSKQIHDAELLQLSLTAMDTVQIESSTVAHENVEPITADEIYQRLETRLQKRHNSDATTFSSSSSITLKMSSSPTASINGLDIETPIADTTTAGTNAITMRNRRTRRQSAQREQQKAVDDTDSECSDESGYVEYQEKEHKSVKDTIALFSAAAQTKPQPPPKPMPRRSLQQTTNATKNTSTAV